MDRRARCFAWRSGVTAGLLFNVVVMMLLTGRAAFSQTIHEGSLSVAVAKDGTYTLNSTDVQGPVVRASVAADLSGTSLTSSAYPQHLVTTEAFEDVLGTGQVVKVRNTGLRAAPDLLYELRLYHGQPWGTLQEWIENTTSTAVVVRTLRFLNATGAHAVQLSAADSADRVLSDSFSEDGPNLHIKDLDEATNGLHRGFNSQLIFNRQSGESLFLGAFTAARFLTVLDLAVRGSGDAAQIVSLRGESTGTQEALPERGTLSPPHDDAPLQVTVQPGESLHSEAVMFAIGRDYHQQLENYGRAVRVQNKARVSLPTPIGWWSWTAFYYGVTQANVLTNAAWLAENLLPLGYQYFQVDEGYQYARGEYATSDRKAFPDGMSTMGYKAHGLGLTFGVWVAPFQVSERSWVFEHHPEWLVHTRSGKLVHIGQVGGHFDELYALDATHPGAQEYLRSTYRTLVKEWNVRFIKMDFMDSTAVEGVFYRPNTSALQAMRIGLEVIRETVGDDVVLDKDGSPMLTPVGLVDAGRTSQDTGHTFDSTRDAASGVVARYYMHRNFYVTDPDAFTVSTEVIPDRGWHGNKAPLTQDEAEASIALSSVSGGMFEIGDDLPTLGSSPDRLALVRNPDLIAMARLGRAATPLDLMTYLPKDRQPSLFLLQESARQRVLTVFNWTEEERTHTMSLGSLGLDAGHAYAVHDVLRGADVPLKSGEITVTQPAHSVRMLKLVDTSVAAVAPRFEIEMHQPVAIGQTLTFSARQAGEAAPSVRYSWDFGDGVTLEGTTVQHAYTLAGHYTVRATAYGVDGLTAQQTREVTLRGYVPTVYDPEQKERLTPGK